MWYFGAHGDLNMKGAKPANGREGLKAYDPAAYALLDKFYSGRMEPEAPSHCDCIVRLIDTRRTAEHQCNDFSSNILRL